MSAICLAIIGFMHTVHPSPLLDEMLQVVEQTTTKRSLAGLRTLLRDLREWATGMDQGDIGRLNERLKQQFGKDLNGLVNVEKVVRSVLKAGAVRTDEEYRLLERYVDEAAQASVPSSAVEQVNELLRAYRGAK